jgi:hypothetical protein
MGELMKALDYLPAAMSARFVSRARRRGERSVRSDGDLDCPPPRPGRRAGSRGVERVGTPQMSPTPGGARRGATRPGPVRTEVAR